MPTPYAKATNADLVTLESTTIGNAKPYQLRQVHEALQRVNWERGSDSDVSVQPTVTTIISALNGENP